MSLSETILTSCELCPRKCGADRLHGQKGFCGETGRYPRAARAGLHLWEEPCVSGETGSGTIFFSGCTMRCDYCQNRSLSRGEVGFPVTPERFAKICLSLEKQGANNINLVTPTHFLPMILEGIPLAREAGVTVPFLMNCGGYERAETLRLLEGSVSVYLPDFKYWEDETAIRYSSAPEYRDYAKKAIREMVRQTGKPVFNEKGILQRGVIVRHLLLPGHLEESKKILEYLSDEYGDRIILSIMNQYTPMPEVIFPELKRPVTEEEYEALVFFAEELGIENAYIQEGGTVTESFIPAFDGTGIL
ncbi:MAG: radical SAM protein [Lachnospiraceae bacterium]|nr:radical SAM protein [Lachnospiraceae bacterium]